MLRLAALAAILLLFAGPLAAAEGATPTHAIAMHGEPKYGPEFRHFDYVDPNAPKGGEVRLNALNTFDNLNPFIIKGVPAVGSTLPFETLLIGSADEAFTEYGLVAETVEMPDDRSWVSFTLRPEARFHDGKPITPEDVLFSFDVLKAKGQPFFRLYYAAVEKVEKIGDRKVRFTFAPGVNRELPLIVGQMPILPKHYWDGRQFDQTTLEAPLGSGPYRIASFEPGRYVIYERVKDYWGKDLPVRRGQFNFDRIRYDYYRDSTVAREAFKAGQYDFRPENEAKAWATEYDFPAIRQGLAKKERIDHDRPTGMQAYAYNIRRPLFEDPRVRQALAYAFDFEWTNQNLFYGQYTRTGSYFSNSDLAAEGPPGPAELALLDPLKDQIPPEAFAKEYQPPKSDGSGNIRAGLRTAMDLLKAAGWEVRNGRLTHAQSGRPFEFEILLDQPVWERITLPFVKNLERLGIKATVRTVDTAQYQNRLDDFDYDMIVDVWGQSLSPGNEQRNFWGSDAADSAGSNNTVGIKNPAVDALIEKVIAAPDREALRAATAALDRVLLWNHYVIPHWHIGYDRVAYWDKFGRPEVTPTQGYQFFAWWIDPQKQAAKPPAKQTGLIGSAVAQETPRATPDEAAEQPTTPGGAGSLPAPITPGTPPEEAQTADPYETAPAREVVPTPAAESPGISWLTWIGLALVVVVILGMRYMRRGR